MRPVSPTLTRSAGARGAPARQQKLAWSIGWSYDLCTPTEQRLWGRLSVFAGSFEPEAAEDICGENLTHEDVIELIFSLVDKSILIRTESDGTVRFACSRPCATTAERTRSVTTNTSNSGGGTCIDIASCRVAF